MSTDTPDATSTDVRFGLLGPLEVTVGGRDVALGGLRPRTLLAVLLTADGATVSEDTLIDALWGEDPPAGARNSLQSHVSRLRAALAAEIDGLDGRLRRQPRGYQVDVGPGELDVHEAEARLARAREGSRPAAERVALLEAARACWRGPALADLADAPGFVSAGLAASRARFDELEATVVDELVAARLDTGAHLAVLPELEQLAGRRPDREHTQRLLALALHRSGRTADGLAVLRRYRQRLADETGLDPSRELEQLEQAMLIGDARIAAPPTAAVRAAEPTPSATQHRPSAGILAAAPLVGRQDDLARVAHALASSRLVTLTGPGGVGKTRLAREAIARRQPAAGEAPTLLLELAPLRQPDAVVPALAALVDVRPGPGVGLVDAVVSYLASTHGVVVIDNCEHLLGTVAELVHRLLTSAPDLTVLTTSRERLGVDGEQVLPVAPLAVPAVGTDQPVEGDRETDAVVLFMDRATRVRPTFELTATTRPVVADLCRHLDGLPLAIELAAAQLGALGLADLRDRLDHRLDLLARLARGPDGVRHATLRAVVEWSDALLDEPARAFYAQLGIFDGGFTLAAAERVVRVGEADGTPNTTDAVQVLARLVDASLVSTTDDGHGRLRYGLLETLRTHARERLEERGEHDVTAARHRAWAVDLVESAAPDLDGPGEVETVGQLRDEFANLRSAWHSAMVTGDLEAASRITVALTDFAHWQGNVEVWSWARRLADAPPTDPQLQVALHGAAAQAGYLAGDFSETERHARAGLQAAADSSVPRRWWCLVGLHVLAMYEAAYAEAEALAREAGAAADVTGTWSVVLAGNAALARLYGGDVAGARAALGECRARSAACGSPTGRAWTMYVEGEIAAVDDPGRAVDVLEACVATARAVGATFVSGVATVGLAAAATRLGDADLALARFPEVVLHWQRTGMWVQQWSTLRNLAELLAELGRDAPAAILLAAAEHAPGAAAVTGDAADRLATLRHRLDARLGTTELDRLTQSARELSREEVVAFALDATTRD